jgi:hypothetical protein
MVQKVEHREFDVISQKRFSTVGEIRQIQAGQSPTNDYCEWGYVGTCIGKSTNVVHIDATSRDYAKRAFRVERHTAKDYI